MPFLLLDPGVTLSPETPNADAAREFWIRVIEWSTDRRAQLGAESYGVVIDHFVRLGWPEYQPPFCPAELGREARLAINGLLARPTKPESPPTCIPDLDPPYVKDENAACALGMDIVSSWSDHLLGIASHVAHWARASVRIKIEPPPPADVALLFVPHQVVPEEADLKVRDYLAGRRINIVGGRVRDVVTRSLIDLFGVEVAQINWTETEAGREPDLNSWRDLRPNADLAICVVGCEGTPGMGHAGSERAKTAATRRGVAVVVVERPNEIVVRLRERFGRLN